MNQQNDLPLGFGMALAQNTYAMEYFAALPKAQQDAVLEQAKSISSSSEMHTFVSSLISH